MVRRLCSSAGLTGLRVAVIAGRTHESRFPHSIRFGRRVKQFRRAKYEIRLIRPRALPHVAGRGESKSLLREMRHRMAAAQTERAASTITLVPTVVRW